MITDMTTQEKSVRLAGLVGWEIEQGDDYVAFTLPDGTHVSFVTDEDAKSDMLYDPSFMSLAWRVLNWAADNQMIIDYCREDSFMEDIEQYWSLPPVEAQRIWLDKILELCLESGLITP